jgi:hypothetical protein
LLSSWSGSRYGLRDPADLRGSSDASPPR